MKKAVVTVTIGDQYKKLAELTHPSIRAYANKIGADFIILDKKEIATTTPHWEKFKIFHLLNQYNRIIYVDTDLIIRDDCPDLFDIVPQNKFGVFNEGRFIDRSEEMRAGFKQYVFDLPKWDKLYYNTGVMVISRQHKFIFEKPSEEIPNAFDMTLINLRLIKSQTEIFELPHKLNRMDMIDRLRLTGEPRHGSYIIHYTGAPQNAELHNVISNDLLKWERTPDYNFPSNIHIQTHGGMGDQMCAEPVIRYIIENAFKGANITVETWFPRLFRHLPVKLFQMGKFRTEPDTPYFLMETLVSPEKPVWAYASANLMHNTDFASINCLHKILPDADKQFRLSVTIDDIAELTELVGQIQLDQLVLVHPGFGWATKTFPSAWWSKVIKGLVDKGQKVAVIGKNINENQGLVDIDIPDGVYDLRNVQTLGSLIGSISQAKTLITNDSAPVHLAGAFNNNIIVIPTCKHPDHILPLRNSQRYYKARALYKELMCDAFNSVPTFIDGKFKTIDEIPGGDIHRFIPEPEEVVAAAIEMDQK